MFYSDVIDMLCLYIQQSLFDLLQNSVNELLLGVVHHRSAVRLRILLSVTEWQVCMLSDFLCRLHAYVQM